VKQLSWTKFQLRLVEELVSLDQDGLSAPDRNFPIMQDVQDGFRYHVSPDSMLTVRNSRCYTRMLGTPRKQALDLPALGMACKPQETSGSDMQQSISSNSAMVGSRREPISWRVWNVQTHTYPNHLFKSSTTVTSTPTSE
jgi:hypothetical protein